MSLPTGTLCQVINLDRSSSRLARIAKTLEDLHIEWQRLPAVDPDADQYLEHPMYDQNAALHYVGRPLLRGEVGCFLSHIGALERFVQTNSQVCLILEDDAALAHPEVELLSEIINWLQCDGSIKWGCVNLSKPISKWKRRLHSFDGAAIFRAYRFPILATGLLWSRRGAADFLSSVNATLIYAPFDVQLRAYLTEVGTGLAVDKALVTVSGDETTIGNGRAHSNGWKYNRVYFQQKFPEYWSAFHHMVCDQIARRRS